MQSMQLVQMCVYTHSNMIYPRARPVDAYGPAAYGPAAYGCMVQLHMDQLYVPWGRRARLSARYVVVNCRALACFSSLCTSTLTHVIPDLRRVHSDKLRPLPLPKRSASTGHAGGGRTRTRAIAQASAAYPVSLMLDEIDVRHLLIR
jgi:hypothetical protein